MFTLVCLCKGMRLFRIINRAFKYLVPLFHYNAGYYHRERQTVYAWLPWHSSCGRIQPDRISYRFAGDWHNSSTHCCEMHDSGIMKYTVWPKTRPGPRKRGRLGLKSGPARPEPFTCHYWHGLKHGPAQPGSARWTAAPLKCQWPWMGGTWEHVYMNTYILNLFLKII